MTKALHIARGFSLPIDYVTSTGGILAKKGAGKSNTAVVMAEEMFKAGVPWVAIDPKGDWWGIRSSADGTGPGLPVVVFGGRHADVPLEPTAGALIADLVLAERLTCVLDVSEFSKADTRRFLLAFAERLYRQADSDPLHLFLEEAHEYLPQMVRGDDAQLVGAWQKIVKQGRFKGLGVTIISQRSAAVNKDVLTQCDTLIAMRTTSPQDRKAIDAWIDVHADSDEALKTLPSLSAGEAWVWAPEWDMLQRVTFRRRSTFDSGATPKVGETRKPPKTIADVDLGAIKEAMAETIERSKKDDPNVLRAQIAELRKTLIQRERELQDALDHVVSEQIPYVPDGVLDALQDAEGHLRMGLQAANDEALACLAALGRAIDKAVADDRQDVPRALPAGGRPRPVVRPRPQERPDPPARRDTGSAPVPRAEGTDSLGLSKAERNILGVLASFHPEAVPRKRLAIQADYHERSKSYTNALSHLRTLGYITRGDRVNLTEAGREAAPAATRGPRTAAEIVEHWKSLPKIGKAAGLVLDACLEVWPRVLTTETLADIVGYHPRAKSFTNAVSQVRALGLIEGRGEVRLSDDIGGLG